MPASSCEQSTIVVRINIEIVLQAIPTFDISVFKVELVIHGV